MGAVMVGFSRLVFGIDPGKTGCVAALGHRQGTNYARFQTHEPWDTYTWFRAYGSDIGYLSAAFMEHVHVRGDHIERQASNGKMLREAHIIEGFLIATQIKYELVEPQTWLREFALGGIPDYNQRQRRIKEKAQELFPEIKMTLDMGAGFLIAEYGRRKLTGELTNGRSNTERREGTGIRW